MHGISVIKTRWSLTTEIADSSFYCNHEIFFAAVATGLEFMTNMSKFKSQNLVHNPGQLNLRLTYCFTSWDDIMSINVQTEISTLGYDGTI